MIDHGFPVIDYKHDQTPRERGRMHGETFREGILELAEIRLNLMRHINPNMTEETISELAAQQWMASEVFDRDLTMELQGICDGAGITRDQLVVLNNYTDFRDINLPDEGCSLVYVNYGGNPVMGQTWDMHGSAKNYLCAIRITDADGALAQVILSVVGCPALMGYTNLGTCVGVNNITTSNAKAGTIWAVIVRKMLNQKSYEAMVRTLDQSSPASGHHYCLASTESAGMFEVMPGLTEQVGANAGEDGAMYHTNHCLGREAAGRQLPVSKTSTTHIRYNLLEKKIGNVKNYDDVYKLLNDHENYPKGICFNFEYESPDRTLTCGGAVGDLNSGRVRLWRGDKLYDDNFVEHEFNLPVAKAAKS
ncbi:MAG: C45 family peptidase [Planctomycetota bacterium]